MNRYETVFILTPVLSEKNVEEAVYKFKSNLKENNGKVLHHENWGLKKLAYPIQKKNTGFYHLVEFEAQADTISKIELELKRDEKVIRFLTVKMNKNHIEFAEKRRNKNIEINDQNNIKA